MGSNIIFVVPKLESSLLKSNTFEIVMTSQIQMADNKDPDDTVICAPLNAVSLLAFESISCQIGSEYICRDNWWDVYKVWYNLIHVNVTIFTIFQNYFQLALGNSSASKDTWLSSLLFFKDEAGKFDSDSMYEKIGIMMVYCKCPVQIIHIFRQQRIYG